MKITFLKKILSFGSGIPNNTKKPFAKVLTIGNFDGLHLGHQAMINQTLNKGNELGLQTAVMVFEPMPKELFAPAAAPARLTNMAETQEVFSGYSHNNLTLDELIIADFNQAFSALSAQQFADILIEQLNVKALILGDDFRFGNDRTGDADFLRSCGLQVTTLKTVTDTHHDNERISSTRIRELLNQGNLTHASQLLGRDYFMIGKVQHGDKIGRTLNFPTANVSLDRLKPALHGVFAVDVQVLNEEGDVCQNTWNSIVEDNQVGIKGLTEYSLFGTANIGTRPAVNGKEWRLEVHFPKFKGDLYGKILKVRFLHFLHGEKNYDGLQALKAGIKKDVIDLLAWRELHIKQ